MIIIAYTKNMLISNGYINFVELFGSYEGFILTYGGEGNAAIYYLSCGVICGSR